MPERDLPDAFVEFSDTAAVEVKGSWYNPFQRNSWSARVTFDDGRVVIVVLPQNARQRSQESWLNEVIMAAEDTYNNEVVMLDG